MQWKVLETFLPTTGSHKYRKIFHCIRKKSMKQAAVLRTGVNNPAKYGRIVNFCLINCHPDAALPLGRLNQYRNRLVSGPFKRIRFSGMLSDQSFP